MLPCCGVRIIPYGRIHHSDRFAPKALAIKSQGVHYPLRHCYMRRKSHEAGTDGGSWSKPPPALPSDDSDRNRCSSCDDMSYRMDSGGGRWIPLAIPPRAALNRESIRGAHNMRYSSQDRVRRKARDGEHALPFRLTGLQGYHLPHRWDGWVVPFLSSTMM